MELFDAAFTLSPLLMITAALLFGQTAARERAEIREEGDRRRSAEQGLRARLNAPFRRPRVHAWLVGVAALVAAVPPVVVLVLSAVAVTDERIAAAVEWPVLLLLMVQILTAGLAVAVRVIDGTKLAGE